MSIVKVVFVNVIYLGNLWLYFSLNIIKLFQKGENTPEQRITIFDEFLAIWAKK